MINNFRDIKFVSFAGSVNTYQLMSYLGQKIDCYILWKIVLMS